MTTKFSAFTSQPTLSGTDELVGLSGSTNSRWLGSVIREYMVANGLPQVLRFPFAFDTPNITNPAYAITALDQGAKTFTIAGDHAANFPAAGQAVVADSTGNDATYTVVTGVFGAGNTVITVSEVIPDSTVDGAVYGTAVGAVMYTPTVDDILMNAWIEVDEAWDGDTPFATLGTFVETTAYLSGRADLTQADSELFGKGVLVSYFEGGPPLGNLSLVGDSAYGQYRTAPSKFVAANPLRIVITQDGSAIGADPGSTQGSGILYLVVATPVAG